MAGGSVQHLADIRSVLAAHLPGRRVESVVRIGAGLANVAYEVDGDLIVRFSKEPDPVRRAGLVDREARLLTAVAAVSPLPVPAPVFTAAAQGCLGYAKLPGVVLLEVPPVRRRAVGESVAATLGEFLAALHAVPVDRMTDLVDTDDDPLDEWLQEAAASYRTAAGAVPAGWRRAVEAFLAASPPDGDHVAVFSHNDLGIEHVLVDPDGWTVSGIIDWGDAAIADPAYDFGLLYRDLGPAAARAAVRRYRTGIDDVAAFGRRAVFYARCGVLEDLAYGVDTGRVAYVDKSLAAMEWLFTPQRSPDFT